MEKKDTTSTLFNCSLANLPTASSSQDHQSVIDSLQRQTISALIPAMVFLSTLFIVGTIGNSLVLVVYGVKFSRTPMGILIMSIAVYDLLINFIVIPGEVYDMFHQWDFNIPALCKARKFFNVYTTVASGMTLVAIAVTRYKRICQPLIQQITTNQVYCSTVIIVFASFACSLPFSLINGRHTRNTTHASSKGYSCDVDDAFVSTLWPLANSVFFVAVYLFGAMTIAALYGLIWIKAWNHRNSMCIGMGRSISDSNLIRNVTPLSSLSIKNRKRQRLSRSTQTLNNNDARTGGNTSVHIDVVSDTSEHDVSYLQRSLEVSRRCKENILAEPFSSSEAPSKEHGNQIENTVGCKLKKKSSSFNPIPKGAEEVTSFYNNCSPCENFYAKVDGKTISTQSFKKKHINITGRRFLAKPTTKQRRASQRFSKYLRNKRCRNFGRTSYMLLRISVVFFFNYLPFIILQVYKNAAPEAYNALEGVSFSFYHLFYRSYLLNSALNPLIYSMCDLRFRQETLKLFRLKQKTF